MNLKRVWMSVIFVGVGTLATQSGQTQQGPSLEPATGHIVQALRGGTPQSFTIQSAILKEKRRILVLVPNSYSQSAPERRYPVTVVTDGDYLLPAVAVSSDELSRNGQIPESVIVGIENTGATANLDVNQKRVYDLTPPGLSVSGSGLNEGGDLFLDFIEKELLPAVDRQFRTAAPRFFVGVSSGGILATYAAATRPAYSAVVSLDAPIHFGDNWLAKKLIARASAGGRPVRFAALEAQFKWPEAEWKRLTATAPASWKLYRETFQLEGHETLQMVGAYIGLRQVFSDYSRFSHPVTPTTSILPYYQKVSESLGSSVLPPRRVLANVIDDLLGEGRGTAAREAYNMLIYGYGAPVDNAKLVARIEDVEKRPAPAETVESLLATPFPSPEEARAVIGEWVGDITMRADTPRTGKTKLRIRVVDGRVVGEMVAQSADGEVKVRWDYLRVTPQGMTWGRLNEKRPRGMMVFEGKIEGDILYGQGQLRGVKLEVENPPGPLHFYFKRVHK